jgi:hypothetical protein
MSSIASKGEIASTTSASTETLPVEKPNILPLELTQCYVRDFLAKSNPNLGRKGPTCPFVPASLKHDTIHLALVTSEFVSSSEDVERVALSMLDRFKMLEPTSGPQAPYKAIIMIFPDVTLADAPYYIDDVQKKLKPFFVKDGLMLGEFHRLNNAPGLHNPSFYPLRTPYPCLAVRNMVRKLSCCINLIVPC